MKSVYFLKIPGIYIWSMYSSDKTKTVIRIFKDYDMNIVFRDCQMLFNPPPKCGEGIIGQSTLAVSALYLTYALMDYHLTCYKCCPH